MRLPGRGSSGSGDHPTDLIQVIEINDLVTPFANKLRRYVECPWVDYAQPNFIYSATTVVNDPYYTNPGQPNLVQVNAPAAWNLMNGGTHGTQNLVVAVGDTGANLDHPDFAPNLSPGAANFIEPGNGVNDPEIYDPSVAVLSRVMETMWPPLLEQKEIMPTCPLVIRDTWSE